MKKTAILAIIGLCTVLNAHADTIYLCKSYSGAAFWTNVHCSKQSALIDRIATVSPGPFDKQIAEAERQQRSAAKNTGPAFDRGQYCEQLINERRQIESRYSNWQWQPPEVINPDQKRTRAINAELAINRCRLQ
jgi:hypothetical protein